MAVDTNNIEIGEGDLTLQFDLEDEPTDVGGCIGAELEIKTKDLDVNVGQYIDAIDTFDISREIMFSITLKEDTMRNFVTALGGDPGDITVSDNVEIYSLPSNSVNSSKFAELIYKVARVRDKTKFKTVTLYRVKSKGGIKYSFNKDKEIQYKVTFQAYADPVHDGKPGKLEKDQLEF
jgi:hypothetical protein